MNNLILFMLRSAAIAAMFVVSGAGAQPAPSWYKAAIHAGHGYYTDRIIVKYKTDSTALPTAAQSDSRAKAHSAAVGTQLTHLRSMSTHTDVFRLPTEMANADVRIIARQLASDPEVEYAEPDYKAFPAYTPTDPGFSIGLNVGDQTVTQWYLTEPTGGINATTAWNTTRGSINTTVAVIDTGVLNHTDLRGRLVQGFDFIGPDPNGTFDTANDGNGRDSDSLDPGTWISPSEAGRGNFSGCPDPSDSDWHGTHVAGIIGANPNNGSIAGIDHFAKILPVRTLGKCGGYTSDIIDSMRWAAGIVVTGVPNNTKPAHVLNMSLSIAADAGKCSQAMQSAINDVVLLGKTIVTAAGNDGPTVKSVPAICAGVISVSSTTRTGGLASYSYFGVETTVSAPGGFETNTNGSVDFQNGILSLSDSGTTSPNNNGGVASLIGTSFSAAIVSGVASLLTAVNGTLSPAQIKAVLQSTARKPAIPSEKGLDCSITTQRCYDYLIDAAAAVTAAQNPMLATTDTNGLSLSLLAFESTAPGRNSLAKKIVIQNPNGLPIRIFGVSLAGKDNADFSSTTTCFNPALQNGYPFDLPAGTSCDIDVTFKPSIEGVRAAEIVVASNVNIPVAITGSGTAGSGGGAGSASGGGGCTLGSRSSPDLSLLVLLALGAMGVFFRRSRRA